MRELKSASFALSKLGLAMVVALAPFGALAANEQAVQLAQYQVLDEEDGASAQESPSVEQLPGSESSTEVESVATGPQFTWIVTKEAQALSVSGKLPNEAIGGMLALEAGGWSSTDTEIGEGEPSGFYRDALAALEALALLEEGGAGFDGASWFVEGTLQSGADADDVNDVIAYSEAAGDHWTVAVEPGPVDVSASSEDDSALPEIRSVVESLDSDDAEAAGRDPSGQSDAGAGEVPAAEAPEAADVADAATTADEVAEPEPAPEPQPAAPDPDYSISVIKDADGGLTVRGSVPDSGVRTRLASAAGRVEAVGTVEIDPAAPENFTNALFAGIEALEFLQDGRVAFENGAWLMSGNARIDTDKTKALEALERGRVQESFRVIVAAPSARAACEAELTAFMADKAILFGSGSTRMTAESETLLPQVAEHLAVCPDAVVYVEGHTDSDGLDSANLTLSIARAEAVVDGLIELGIAPNRLYAVGYGESLPVASNDTQSGKFQNRRIVFSFDDDATQIEPEDQP